MEVDLGSNYDYDGGDTGSAIERAPKRRRTVAEEPEDEPQEAEESAAIVPETESSTPPAPSDPFKKRKLQIRIRAYVNRFGDRLNGVDFISELQTKSEEELEHDLEDIQFLVAASSPGTLWKYLVSSGVKAWSVIASDALEMKVRELPVILERNKEWGDLVDELALQYSDISTMDVRWRALGFLVHATATLDTQNQNVAAQEPPDRSTVPLGVQQRYQDL